MNKATFLNQSESRTSRPGRSNSMALTFIVVLVIGSLSRMTKAQDSNTFYGDNAGHGAIGVNDSAFGWNALEDYYTTTASYDVAVGSDALPPGTHDSNFSNSTAIGQSAGAGGDDNTTVGSSAGSTTFCANAFNCYLQNNTTAVGYLALDQNTWWNNTGTGYGAIDEFSLINGNNGGSDNTGNGYLALHRVPSYEFFSEDWADNNTATGALTIGSDLTDSLGTSYTSDNTAHGAGALQYCSKATCNTAIGAGAIAYDSSTWITGYSNTADGWNALLLNFGSSNVAAGYVALSKNTGGESNTALGDSALLGNDTGSTNTALGDAAGASLTTGSNNIDISSPGVAGESNTIRIGTRSQTVTNITGIRGTTVSGGIAVMIDAAGRLGTTTSSAHFKEKIKPMAKNSEAIYSLQPVTFRYKKTLDPAASPQFGLVAEEVAKVDPDLVVRDEQGKPYTVRYDAVNAMLLNEFLKQDRKVEDQTRMNQKQLATNRELQSILARQNAELDAIAAQISY